MTRQRCLIAGNWKMNGLTDTATALAEEIAGLSRAEDAACDVAVCPPFTALSPVAKAVAGTRIRLGAQDCHQLESGAFTGSVSAPMLADVGCRYVIVGHSERRHGLGETDDIVLAKAEAAIKARLTPIICVGETLEQRESGEAESIVGNQIGASVPADGGNVVVAYEPVWAIGTGLTASAEDIAAMHNHIRARLTVRRADGPGIPIQYGGSAKPDNAASILSIENVGGLLVGGASLQADSFWQIVQAAGS